MLVVAAGAVAGRTLLVAPHPNSQKLWLARVDIGDGKPFQIVFGGDYEVQRHDLVAVAPPGAQVIVLDNRGEPRRRKMRSRRYRGQVSHGMFCSLDELGWYIGGPDEVAVLRGLEPGDCLHSVRAEDRVKYVERPDSLLLADVNDAARDGETSQTVTK